MYSSGAAIAKWWSSGRWSPPPTARSCAGSWSSTHDTRQARARGTSSLDGSRRSATSCSLCPWSIVRRSRGRVTWTHSSPRRKRDLGDPRGCLTLRRATRTREPVNARVQHGREFCAPVAEHTLREQGARCMDCGVPFCQSDTGCPVRNVIPDWNDLVYRGRWREALDTLHATNNFPELTGRLCPAPCESACVLSLVEQPVAIRTIEQAIADRGFAEQWVTPQQPREESGRRVAVIGSGPTGLAAAQQLRRFGHSVVVFEKADRLGGLLRYGIPDFKLEKSVIDRRVGQMEAEGVIFCTEVEVGVDLSIASLLGEFDAMAMTGGAEQPRDLEVPGRELDGI